MDAFSASPQQQQQQQQSADSDTSPVSAHQPLQSPAAAAPPTRSVHHSASQSRSCHTCRRRKVKCDKMQPCSNCTKARVECLFPGPGRAPRKVKPPKSASERETELLKRLRRLEGVVEELSGQVDVDTAALKTKKSPASSRKEEEDTNSHGSLTSASKPIGRQVKVTGMDEGTQKKQWMMRLYGLGEGPPSSEHIMHEEFGKLVISEPRSRYVNSDYWARLNSEIENVRGQINESEDESSIDEALSPDPSPTTLEPDHQSFLLGYSSANVDLFQLHPHSSQIPYYWDIYCQNVDPLIKITHIPTVSKTIETAREDLRSLSPSTEALIFAIYFAAITSLTEDEVRANFGLERRQLLVRYRFGTEQALARAGFLSTTEFVTLQAFVLFLVCVRRHDTSRVIWSLVGLAIRIAQSISLHRDGAALGLPPFESEIRRRLWWQIVLLDFYASDPHGLDLAIQECSFDCKLPLNLNDTDFDSSIEKLPAPREGISEMTFCLIRYEIVTATRRLDFRPPESPCFINFKTITLADKEKMVQEFTHHLEHTYLKHCDKAGPLFWVAATVARMVISKMPLVIYGFRPPGREHELPQEIRDKLFISSVEVLEYTRLLENESTTQKWGFLFHTYVQWHAIAYILREICVRPPSASVERGWQAVNAIFTNWAEALRTTDRKGLLWVTVRKLMIKAKQKRQADMDAAMPSAPLVSQDASSSSADLYIPLHCRPPHSNSLSPSFPQGHMPTLNLGVEAMLNSFHVPDGHPGWVSVAGAPMPMASTDMQGVMAATTQSAPVPVQFGFQAPPVVPGMPTRMPGPSQDQSRPSTWLFDDPALTDLDMNGADAEINWEGWDDVVRNFQMDQGAAVDSASSMWW